jgi:hypothetical protein
LCWPTGAVIRAVGDCRGFLRGQLLTTRNVCGHWLTGFMPGILNDQIEHRLSRYAWSNLRRADDRRGVLRQHGLAHR